MSVTPLSDLIAQYSVDGDPGTYARFLDLFRESTIGVVGIGAVKEDDDGRQVTAAGFGIGRTTHGDGQPRILAFADPETAAQALGSQCNAGVPGGVLLEMLAADPECAGILVNSATAQISIVISKAAAQ